MASIPGSHFVANAPNQTVNVVETSGGRLPPPVPGEFNLEVWTGNPADTPSQPARGYQGLAVLSDGNETINLVSGAFAVADAGSGQDSIIASGTNETISGGTANVTLTLAGNNDVANAGGNDTITASGDFDTINGGGNDLIAVWGNDDVVNAGTGNDTILVFGQHDTINGGVGNRRTDVFGSHDSVGGGTGNAAVGVFGDHNTVAGGVGNETIAVFGDSDLINTGTGIDSITVFGRNDTVEAGNGGPSEAQITVGGSHFTFTEGPGLFADTIVGFDQAAGDRIDLTTESKHAAIAGSKQVNHGQDTLITLNDGSTLLLKGVSHIDPGFFK